MEDLYKIHMSERLLEIENFLQENSKFISNFHLHYMRKFQTYAAENRLLDSTITFKQHIHFSTVCSILDDDLKTCICSSIIQQVEENIKHVQDYKKLFLKCPRFKYMKKLNLNF